MALRIDKNVVVTTLIDFLRYLRPVGQGAFYTEVFKQDDDTLFTIVYDCGTEIDSSILEAQINEFKKRITQIDLLFISHFHRTILMDLTSCWLGFRLLKRLSPCCRKRW